MAQTKKEQTKGIYKLAGKVKGINNDNALRDGVTRNDDPYKSLSFFVETSPTNAIKVELFGMERDNVIFWNSKEKDKKKARKDVPWDQRHESHAPFGLMGVRLGLEKKPVNMVEWDAIDYLVENLNDGDDVYVTGTIDFQQYQDQQGNWKESTRYTIGNVSTTKKPVDFDDEKFVEIAGFEQEIVVTDVAVTEESKLMIGAKVIDYKGEDTDTSFMVDPETHKKLANNLKKRLKWGDAIKVYGLCINAVETEEVAGEEEEDDWGSEMPAGMNTIRNYIQELRITAVDSSTYEPKKYTEEDFFSEDEDNFGDDDTDLGDDFDDDDFDDEDLPF
jgi:hypothetical protein